MPEDSVSDNEILYRAVLAQYCAIDAAGERRLSSQAFADRQRRPSVDRAHLRDFNPVRTQFNPKDAVISKTAQQVRSIRCSRSDAKGIPIQNYVADVEPKPKTDNPAHAEIYGRPEFDNDRLFKRICESLVRDITWELHPTNHQN